MALISLKHIYKSYHIGESDIPILQDINIDIKPGEMIALMGTSGSGKSTLMNILGCLDHPNSGEYFLEGKNISQASSDERAELRNQKFGFIFQNFNLLPRTSALENVLLPLNYSTTTLSEQEEVERAKELLIHVGLEDRLHHEPSQLSGGQQQRVAIARALVNRPPILFADEPTGNLDSKTSEEILNMFEELNEEGITVLLVTHEQEIAQRAKRRVRLKDGRIEADYS